MKIFVIFVIIISAVWWYLPWFTPASAQPDCQSCKVVGAMILGAEAKRDYHIELPRDHGPHKFPNWWWYLVMHLGKTPGPTTPLSGPSFAKGFTGN